MAVDDLRRVDAEDLVDGRGDVHHMVELRTHPLVRLDSLGPGNDHRVARAPEVGGNELGGLERRAARPGPAGVIHVVGLRRAQRLEPAKFVQSGELLLDGVGDVVLREQLADRPLLALGARSVVAEDVEDECVLAQPALVEPLDQAADLDVGVLDEAGEDFHPAALEGALVLGDVVPGSHRLVARGQLGAGRDDAHLELALVDPLPVGFPAVVELAFVFVGPLRPDVVRPVGRAGCPVHQERLVGGEGLVLVEPGERLVHHVLGEVITFVVGRLDGVVVFDQPRFPLRGFTGEEAVEVLKSVAVRPAVLGADRRGLSGGRVVPFAEGRGVVAVLLEHLGDGGGRLGDDAGVAVEGDRTLGDRAGTDAGVVAPGKQRGTGRRADRGGVKRIVAQALVGELAQGWGVHLPAEGVGDSEADVIDQHDQDVGCVSGQAGGFLRPLHFRILQAWLGHAGAHRGRWKGEDRAVVWSFRDGPGGQCEEGEQCFHDGLGFHDAFDLF